MTLQKLIERLEWMKGQVGGECEVKVIDDEGQWGFSIHKEAIDDPKSETGTGAVVHLDLTGEPE
ncbi:hypothetical protein J8F10_01650 [Gemmata sp. G18]|uniref:Uncharacterized protein n=1 Tax=Gemmata palustris TaxID=2822762 RepID=A0ABS5BJX0_9BACT|nr:hypothetical protein [Gemmata palustris]MBP3954002.1 hypothetical protein [Gemmata palustris]